MSDITVTLVRRNTRHELTQPATNYEDALQIAESALTLLNKREDEPWWIEVKSPTETYMEVAR